MITFERDKRRILVVDDDQEVVKMISLVLRDQDFEVITAFNGREAIEQVRSGFSELVLLDLNLPDMNGKEILKKIKEINEDIGIIVVTGYGGEKTATDMMKAGAVDFISKPFETERLIKSITDAFSLRDSKIEDRRYGGLSSLEKFFPFLAHEIRNPLHAIAGALAIIQRRVDLKDETLSRSTKIINEEVQHLTDFVQDCLDFVRQPASGYFIEGQINELISIVMNLISHMFEDLSRKIKITYRLDPQLPKIGINYEEIKQTFLNLIKNSFESMPEGGELVIETGIKTSSPTESVVVSFRDSGSGVRKEDMKHLFDPFFTTKLRGSGLGLAICHRIITERHKGKIEIKSEEGKGTTVIVELPLHRSASLRGAKQS
jgi:signal transduction histidine kinase